MRSGVQPDFVLTKDSGSIRDQSDANRTAGAIVEAFVPLALSSVVGERRRPHRKHDEECPPECDCPCQTRRRSARRCRLSRPQRHAGSGTRRGGPRSLLDRPRRRRCPAAPVNVLLLVEDERSHDRVAPLAVDALVGDRFVPIVADDETRALGETGLLSMAFNVEPTPRGAVRPDAVAGCG